MRSSPCLCGWPGLPGAGPVHTVFNTHWHAEQTGSNEPLGRAGKRIIAHENTRLWLATDVTWPWNGRRFKRVEKIAQPNKTFYTTGELDSSTEAQVLELLRDHAEAGTDAVVEEVLLFGFEFGAIEMKDEEGRWVRRVR